MKKPVFTVRKIANRNPRLPRLYRHSRERIWRLAVVIFLAVVGVASLFFFSGNLDGDKLTTQIDTKFLAGDATGFLGEGFEEEGFSDKAENASLEYNKGDEFNQEGIGTINAVIYNVNDYFRYVAGAMAILYMIMAATQIIIAKNDEGIEKGKKNLKWSVIAVMTVLMISVAVTAFFEGGGETPGESLFKVENGEIIQSSIGNSSWMSTVAEYFKANVRVFFEYLKVITGAFAILFIFLAGTHMISAAGNDEKIEKEKKYLMHAITAFVTILLLDALIFGFIYPDNEKGVSDPVCVEFMNYIGGGLGDTLKTFSDEELSAARDKYIDFDSRVAKCQSPAELGEYGSEEILGVVEFFETLVGGIAIFFIVYSGISIIAAMGNEEQISKHKRTLMWSMAGLAVIILANTLVNDFFFVVDTRTGEAEISTETGIATIAGVVNFVATFVGIFSVVSIIIAGAIWVANFGNTEVADKSKKVILGAVVGVVLSIAAYAIVNSVLHGNLEGSGSGLTMIEPFLRQSDKLT